MGLPKKTKRMTQKIIASEKAKGFRIDKFLQAELVDFSRTDIQKLIENGKVLCNGVPVSKNLRIEKVLEFEILELPEKLPSTLEPEKMDLDIVYEDDDIVVINKPRNKVVHPGSGISKGTLAAGLLYHFKDQLSSVNGPLRPGIVHRLDKDTPGLMVVAKNDHAHRHLAEQLESHTLHRTYNALIWGHPRDLEGVIDAPLGRDVRNRVRQAVSAEGKEARTHYKAKEFFAIATLMELQLETGRTHQIRVHMRHMGQPVFGDPVYEGRDACLSRVPPLYRDIAAKALEMSPAQLLQAVKITLVHPTTGKSMTFKVPLESPFQKVLKYLRKECSCDVPTFDAEIGFRDFEQDMMQMDEAYEEDEASLYPYEEPEFKERLSREERFQMKKDRRLRKKEIELEKQRKKAEKAAIKRGEIPEDIKVVSPGHEPTIDPAILG
jgi:23S rRNA pseudouridine1911/1915/1917 synthase